tara:strand:+ start:2708 stop:3019 length:312 start_codon:yes stop_codon:yes gene_type:complete
VEMTLKVYDTNKDMLVPWFLMASYAYYELGIHIMPDAEFDRIAIELNNHWDDVDHMHKHLITKEMLATSSGYSIEYTNMIKYATQDYIKSLTKNQIRKFNACK